jgi:hypothetical protein
MSLLRPRVDRVVDLASTSMGSAVIGDAIF